MPLSSTVLKFLGVVAAFLVVTTAAVTTLTAHKPRRTLQQVRYERARNLVEATQRVVNFHRNLQWTVDWKPGADPEQVCTDFEANSNNTYECNCGLDPDQSAYLECLGLEDFCNPDESLCYNQTIKIGLNLDNRIDSLETCTEYTTTDEFDNQYEGTTTAQANYSYIRPCVLVDPIAPDDFSSLAGCSATINDFPCNKCEICSENGATTGITLDCCNTNPEGEPLKVTCGPVGGGGAFPPSFEKYDTENMETCSAPPGRVLWLVVALVSSVAVFLVQ